MNHSPSVQLCSAWSIPAYARGHLWVTTPSDAVRAEGAHGLFTLSAPTDAVIIRWGSPAGPALRHLRWISDTLDWNGSVAVGGYIDALHTTELPGLPEALAILFVGGAPLRSDALPFPTSGQRGQPLTPPAFAAACVDMDESVTTWLALDSSPVLALAQDALVTKLRVHLYGRLVDDRHALAEHIALPIALEAITVFAT